MSQKKRSMSRRSFFVNTGAATAAAAALGNFATHDDYEAVAQNVNTNSQPSKLQITDLRVCPVSSSRRYVVRLDTNQGISGYGEVRDGSSPTYALMLTSRILGMNPCNVDKIFRKLKQFGHHARGAGGPVSIEMACWDLAGKAWGVPCWQMLGGKFRDKVLCYSESGGRNLVDIINNMKNLMKMGWKQLKFDTGIRVCEGIEGCITRPPVESIDPRNTEHPFTGITLTDKGAQIIADHVAGIREAVGWEIPIGADHFGHLVIESCIKLAQALDPYNLAYLEDMIPWQYTEQYVRLKNSCTTPIMTGEDIYLKEAFLKLFEAQAISICHPDIASAGGLLETKKIGDLAQEHGISMNMHMVMGPVALFASVHCAAATENFGALEAQLRLVDSNSTYHTLVDGVSKPLVQDGYIPVPDGPGLGVVLNEDAIKRALKDPKNEYFPPTDEWDDEFRINDRLWSLNPGRIKKIQA